MNLKLTAPIFVQLELTEGCNHRCFYCSNTFSHSEVKMNYSQIQRVVDELASNQVFSAVLTGGEPFTHRKGLHYAIDSLDDHEIEAIVNTNLSIPINDRDIAKLRKCKFVLVSFPSYNEATFNETVGRESYLRVMSNLERLTSQNIGFGINQVVTKRNKDQVYETGKFLFEKFKVTSFSASPMVPIRTEDREYSLDRQETLRIGYDLLRLEKDFPEIRTDILECIPACLFPESMRSHRMAHHGCSAGKDMAVISPKGFVRRCVKTHETYGNIFDEDLKVIWERILEFEKPESKLCSRCLSATACSGGCEVRAIFDGTDNLVCGSEDPYKNTPLKSIDGGEYTIPKIRWRKEGDSLLIIGGEDGLVFGNEVLLRFLQSLEERRFSLDEVMRAYGPKSKSLLNYLYNKRLVKK